MKRAVITGPTGSIGLALINELVSNGVEVVAVVRPGSRRADRIKTSDMVKRVDCDLSELNKLPELIREGADVFYHFGWDGTFGNSRNNMYGQNLNVKYALDAVEAAFALGCDTFIGAVSQAEYGRYEGQTKISTIRQIWIISTSTNFWIATGRARGCRVWFSALLTAGLL